MRDDIRDAIRFLGKEESLLFNKAELARRYDCDPRTIDRYLKIQSGELEPKSSSRVYTSKLDDYKSTIINKVDTYGCTAMAAYKFISKKGYTGKYSIVADFVKRHKDDETKKATIRFETNPGLQAQVDWKEDMTLINCTTTNQDTLSCLARSQLVLFVLLYCEMVWFSLLKLIEHQIDRILKFLIVLPCFTGIDHVKQGGKILFFLHTLIPDISDKGCVVQLFGFHPEIFTGLLSLSFGV